MKSCCAQTSMGNNHCMRETYATSKERLEVAHMHTLFLKSQRPSFIERAPEWLLVSCHFRIAERLHQKELHIFRLPFKGCQRLPQSYPIPIPLIEVMRVPRHLYQSILADGRRAVQGSSLRFQLLENQGFRGTQPHVLKLNGHLTTFSPGSSRGDLNVPELTHVARHIKRNTLVACHVAAGPNTEGVRCSSQALQHLLTILLRALICDVLIKLLHRTHGAEERVFTRPYQALRPSSIVNRDKLIPVLDGAQVHTNVSSHSSFLKKRSFFHCITSMVSSTGRRNQRKQHIEKARRR
mmetsp:Transcript_56181/g.98091  ORF Transcript_56181/g.98091 Transcript_56181/m.98091 type:complete len:295 (-) Transcript_56181:81-965(-)